MCIYIYDIASEMFAERSSRKMPQWWWVHRSLFQPTSWPGFKMPWDFPWPPAWWLEGAWAHMYRPGYARIIIYIFYVGIPNKTTNPSVHMYIYIYIHTKKHISWPWFFPNKTHRIHIYIHHQSFGDDSPRIRHHSSDIPSHEKRVTRVPETVAFSTSSTLSCYIWGRIGEMKR